jgi:predicted lipoprotein with Yx(FWY)xxD motif
VKRFALALTATLALGAAAVASASAGPADAGKATATLTVRSSTYGKILFDGRGFVLYGFTKDPRRRSACFGGCATAWPPYLVKKAKNLKVGAGLKASLIGTTKRPGGKLQVTYAGRPLYYYEGDKSPGQILCQNVSEFGGLWLVVRPSGQLVR